MRLTPSFILIAAGAASIAASSCSIYDGDLLGEANGGVGGSFLPPAGGSGGTGIVGDGGSNSGGMTGGSGPAGGMGGEGPNSGGGDGDGGNPGAGGSGGSTPGGCDVSTAGTTISLVDDMRLASNRILTMEGRKGDWLAFHGTDMSVVPDPNASGAWPASPMSLVEGSSDNYALHYVATKLGSDPDQIWQQFGFLLNDGQAYDLSGYDGIAFCARRIPTTPQSLSLRLTTYAEETVDEEEFEVPGGIIPANWGLMKIPFGTSAAWVDALPIAKNIEFLGGNGIEYDIWIDDIVLYAD